MKTSVIQPKKSLCPGVKKLTVYKILQTVGFAACPYCGRLFYGLASGDAAPRHFLSKLINL